MSVESPYAVSFYLVPFFVGARNERFDILMADFWLVTKVTPISQPPSTGNT